MGTLPAGAKNEGKIPTPTVIAEEETGRKSENNNNGAVPVEQPEKGKEAYLGLK